MIDRNRERRVGRPDSTGRFDCAEVRDRLPLLDSGRLDSEGLRAVDAHLRTCAECRAEAEFVSRLRGLRPEPPASLLRGVLSRAPSSSSSNGDDKRSGRVVWGRVTWLSAAAAVVLALGLGSLWDLTTVNESMWTLALEPEPTTWYGDEWMVAGGPVPEALTDEMLMALLEEMDQ